ncbi:MAG: hypothetical protein HUJ53_03175, partial [Holdemanella sp.]|nr:hypothetical protein [Holdemanella sp.]
EIKIERVDMNQCNISNIVDVEYKGTAVKQKPVITYGDLSLEEGKEYKIKGYVGNTRIGLATITIQGLNDFKSTKEITFKITPGAIKGLSEKTKDTSSVTVEWDSVPNCSGYQVSYKTPYTDYLYYDTWTRETKLVVGASMDIEVWVRAYVIENGTRIDGDWGKPINVRTTDIPVYVAPQPTQNSNSNAYQSYSYMVWISSTGKCYHSKSSCSRMKNAWQVSVTEAQSMGLRSCSKCRP